MNGFGGKIERIYRGLGIAAIKPNRGGDLVVFSRDVIKGGKEAFQNIQQGDPVRYSEYPQSIAGAKFADDVWQGDLPRRSARH